MTNAAFRSPVNSMAVLVVLSPRFCLCSCAAASRQITKVEPPNWWTGFVSPVMVLLYGENLSRCENLGLISRSQDRKDAITARRQARVRLAQHREERQARQTCRSLAKISRRHNDCRAFDSAGRAPQQGRFQGVTRDDVIYLIMPDRFADGDPTNNMPKGAAPGHLRSQGAEGLSRRRPQGHSRPLAVFERPRRHDSLAESDLRQRQHQRGLSRLRREPICTPSKTTSARCRSFSNWSLPPTSRESRFCSTWCRITWVPSIRGRPRSRRQDGCTARPPTTSTPTTTTRP